LGTWTRPKRHAYTLSEYERLALGGRVNLSDGHARTPLSRRQREIVGATLPMLDTALSRSQKSIEDEFLRCFFQCGGQHVDSDDLNTFLTFSSSSAIKIAAQYCRINGLSVCLLEPCFDNIVHILRTEGVPILPVREEELHEVDLLATRLTSTTALWLVQPNNPTGFCLEPEEFKRLITAVADRGTTIVLDFCFRMYADTLGRWNQYSELNAAGVTFICIEDTGKTWSLADTKVGITVCSAAAASLIYRLHDELLLNVSPLHLLLLTEFIKDTLTVGICKAVREGVERNREVVHALVQDGVLRHAAPACHNVPMELLGLQDGTLATLFWRSLRDRGIDVLPAENYFWSRPLEGRTLFRVPLSRPFEDIDAAVPAIRQTLIAI